MCDLSVDLDKVAAPFGRSARDFEHEFAVLAPLVDQGIVLRDGSVLRVPPQARAGVRLVCAVFDAYLAKSNAVHAAAV